MKKFLLTSVCLLAMFACQKEEFDESRTVGFEAKTVYTDVTKASYDSQKHAIAWEAGDNIGCFAELSTNVKFSNSESAPSSFSGTIMGNPSVYHFYFPFNKEATASNNVLTSKWDAEKKLKVNDICGKPVLVGKATNLGNGVTFHNGCGLVKFTVTTDAARKLTRADFSGNNGELIAGKYTIDMNSTTPEMVIAKDGAASTITYTGDVDMVAGTSYSFILALPPTDFSKGITIKLWDENNNTLTKSFDKALNLDRNQAVNISTTLEFTAANAKPAVDITVSSFDLTGVSGESVSIDNEKNTITITKSGFTNPQKLTSKIVATASNGEAVTMTLKETTTIVAGGTIHTDNTGTISNPSSFTMNLMMPRVIAITCGDVTKEYTVKFSQLTDSGLPVVYINTATGADVPVDDKDTWIADSEIYIDAEGRKTFDEKALSDLANIKCEIKGRGNTTWDWVKNTESNYTYGAKRPYAIKLDKKKEVLGMAKHKRWVLLNSVADKSLVRNFISYRLANALAAVGSQEWHPSGQLVEVVMNGLHRGNYLLCEQIKIADGARIKGVEYDDEIHTPATTSEISYLLEGDRNWGHEKTGDPTESLFWVSHRATKGTGIKESSNGTSIYRTNYVRTSDDYDGSTTYYVAPWKDLEPYKSYDHKYKFRWGLKSPDDGDLGSTTTGMATAAYKFINKKVTDVEKYFFDGSFRTSTSLDEINQYINLDSFIEYWLVYEIAMNQEPNNPGSCYMHYYNGDGKLYMGPVWDFDYGTFNYDFTDDGYYTNKSSHFQIANALWYCKLLQNTNVQQYIKDNWSKYKTAAQSVANDLTTLKTYLKNSANYNFNLWNMTGTDPNGENTKTFEWTIESRIQANMNSRLSNLETLINNKSYK